MKRALLFVGLTLIAACIFVLPQLTKESDAKRAIAGIHLGDLKPVVDAKLGAPDERFTQYWGYYRIWLWKRGAYDAMIGFDPNDRVVAVGTVRPGFITQQLLEERSEEHKRKPEGVFAEYLAKQARAKS